MARRVGSLRRIGFWGLGVFGVFGMVGGVLTPLAAGGAEPPILRLGPDGVQRAQIVVDSYSFTPDELVVAVNRPVELTLKSVTRLIPHNFVLEAPDAGLTIRQDVAAGKTVMVVFTPTRPGAFKFTCNKRLLFFKSHEARGMVGTLHVRGATP